jgi:DNA repair photolyase
MEKPTTSIRGRGAADNPPNRFERIHVEVDAQEAQERAEEPVDTVFLRDASRSLVVFNDSPDVGYDAGINPYRGCAHGCAYCYARPSHEYLGFSAGLDFETRILVKEDAPELLARTLAAPRWKPQTIGMSGNTDPYQPAERALRITRRCLELLAEFRNPVTVITKGYLVTRDIDLFSSLAEHRAAAVTISMTTLDNSLHRIMEPRASAPTRRLEAIRQLAASGVPVGVNVAPVIPGLTDHELPAILEAAAGAGASYASYILLRLPHGVKELFSDWLERHLPDRKQKVLHRMREMRGGALYDSDFAVRGRGTGPWADNLASVFRLHRTRLRLTHPPELSTAAFRIPERLRDPQFELF